MSLMGIREILRPNQKREKLTERTTQSTVVAVFIYVDCVDQTVEEEAKSVKDVKL